MIHADTLIHRALDEAGCGDAEAPLLKRAADYLDRAAGNPLSGTRHPLGFYCVTIESTPAFDIRLHVWPRLKCETRPHAPVHDHIWNLASLILLGEITNRFFRAVPDDDGNVVIDAVEYDGLLNRFRSEAGRHRLEEIPPRQTLHAGETYSFGAGVLHDSLVPARMTTATLLVASRTDRRNPIVARAAGETAVTMTRESLSANHCRHLLKFVAARCRA